MNTKVLINNLEVNCIIGVFPHEREKTQTLYFDLELTSDFSAATISDSMDDVVDYVAVAETINNFVTDKKFHLLEKMSVDLTQLIFDKWHEVSSLEMTIKKPNAVANTSFVGVSISQTRKLKS